MREKLKRSSSGIGRGQYRVERRRRGRRDVPCNWASYMKGHKSGRGVGVGWGGERIFGFEIILGFFGRGTEGED